LDGKGKYLTTVEEMAAHYLREVRNLQHDGPYYLGGFGMGGAVAYQMAQDLLDQGQETRLLALFDSYNHNYRTSSSSGNAFFILSERVYFHWANMAPLGLRGHACYLAQKLGEAGRRERERLSVKVANLAHRRDSDGNRLVRRFLEDVNDQAAFSYRPKPYSGKLTLFKPHKNYTSLSDPSMGWSKFAPRGLEIITLPVYPGGMFVEPYVIVLADRLRACIDAGQKSEQPLSVYDRVTIGPTRTARASGA
jgi:thioesterase domain-containing protein